MTHNTLTTEQKFQEFLASHGHPLDEQVNHDSVAFHYFKCPHGSKTDARYKFYAEGIAAGYFKCWKCGVEADFCSKQPHEVSSSEWKAHILRLNDDKQKNELEIQHKQDELAKLAHHVFASAELEQANEHSYLKLKQAKSYGLRVILNENEYTKQANCYKGTLLVPCYNSLNTLVNLERIYLDNKENKYKKRPLAGAQRKGTFCIIGSPSKKHEIILIAEGYATGATAYEATGCLTAVAFSCGNILNVASILKEKYPIARLLIIADDDQWAEDPKLRHAGLKSAQIASSNLKDTTYILPNFAPLELPASTLQELKPTDINDLYVLLLKNGLNKAYALDIVRQQIFPQSTLHTEILNELIKKMLTIDFRSIANIKDNEKLKNQHFLILTVEETLKIAKSNNWGLCKNHDFVYVFNGNYWNLIDEEELKTFLGDAAEAMGVDKFCARFFNFREMLYKQFIAVANLPKPEQKNDTVLINLKNGTFEVSPTETKLNNFNRNDFITYQLPFDYDAKAEAPIFATYLNKVLPDKQLQQLLAEYLGYVFIRPTTLKLEKTLLLYGTGANGKSVFYEVVRNLFGEQNTSEYSLQSLTNDNGYFRAMIANKLVNYASEINGKLEASIFKQLVSGEPVEARLPYGRPFTLTRYAKLIFNCNELPKDVEQTEAYFRRFLIVPFNITIPEAEQDKQLAQKIIANELSGIFNWVLEGLKRLLSQKQFTECESVKLAREQYEKESDSVKLFIDEKEYKPHSTSYILLQRLYVDYRQFCQDDGFQPVNKTNFRKRLENCKIHLEKKNIGKVVFLSNSLSEYKIFN